MKYNQFTKQLFGFFGVGSKGVIKTSTDCGRTWEETGDGVGEDSLRVYGFAFNPNGTVYVVGYDDNLYKRQFDLSSIEFDPIAADNALNIAQENGRITIEAANPSVSIEEVRLFNSLGTEISELKQQQAGTGFFSFETDALPSGIYFLRSSTTKGIITSKFCVYK